MSILLIESYNIFNIFIRGVEGKMKIYFNFLSIISIFIFTACTSEHQLQYETILKNTKDHNSTVKRQSIQGEKQSDTDEGVYISDSGQIYIKTNGRSITSIIDELAFKMRFNYVIETPLPKDRLAIYDMTKHNSNWKKQKGMVFDSIEDVLDFLESFMNYVTKNKQITNYKIVFNDDGIEIKSNYQDYKGSYKKVFLYNLTADEAQRKIKEFFFKNHDGSYSILPLKTQNAIIIKSDIDTLRQIGEVLYSIDADSPQVMIEAEVFEYQDTIGRKVGMAIDYSNINGNFAYGVKTVFGNTIANTLPQITTAYSNEEKQKTLLTALALEDRDGGVKILAEPRLVLKPGKEASLRLNTEKYIIVSGVNDSSLEKIETGIVFKITPIILSQSTILLKLHLEQSEFIPSNETQIVQSTNKNLIDTSIVVTDGELISLGGIYLSRKTNFSTGIPVLKDIPGVGQAFSINSNDSSRTMIEFMIRPTIKKLHSKLEHIKANTYRMFYKQHKEKIKK